MYKSHRISHLIDSLFLDLKGIILQKKLTQAWLNRRWNEMAV